MHSKFQKNAPKNKISVHNTKLLVMQTRCTLMTSSTVIRQLHCHLYLLFTLYRGTLRCVKVTQAMCVSTSETRHWTTDHVTTCWFVTWTSLCPENVYTEDFICGKYVTDIHEWFPSMLCTFCPPISKSTMSFKNKASRNTTVYVSWLNESFEVITVCTQNWIAVFTPSLPLTSPFALGCKFNRQHLNVY